MRNEQRFVQVLERISEAYGVYQQLEPAVTIQHAKNIFDFSQIPLPEIGTLPVHQAFVSQLKENRIEFVNEVIILSTVCTLIFTFQLETISHVIWQPNVPFSVRMQMLRYSSFVWLLPF
jgi:hypothetical protein